MVKIREAEKVNFLISLTLFLENPATNAVIRRIGEIFYECHCL
jgi:hypothetical protein